MFAPAPAKAGRCRVLYVSPLKALAVDVERNLRAPLAGIARRRPRRGEPFITPAIAIRTGDTPQSERARFQREPADILITTPESLYLILTSNAREALRSSTRSSSTRFTRSSRPSAARIWRCRSSGSRRAASKPPQRIGLSATQRPLEEVARFLGGVEEPVARVGRRTRPRAPPRQRTTRDLEHEFAATRGAVRYRPVTIVDTGEKKALKLTSKCPSRTWRKLTTARRHPERTGVGRRLAAVDLGGDSSAAARADSRASVDARSSSTAAGWPNGWPAR